jgi:2-dehydro-3-deoxygalactonokinase
MSDTPASTASTAVIALDWGTTSLRAYRLDADGAVLERRQGPLGIMAIDDGAFEEAFEQAVGDWLDDAPAATVILSGMIGSRQGWVEAPYLDCPTDIARIADNLVEITLERGQTIRLAPGLATRNGGVPDVMRGEEVQILGASDELGETACTVCLPGSHSKWARVADGEVVGFSTHMTGEVFDVLRRHSILGRMIEHSAWDPYAFLAGIDRAQAKGGFLAHLFGVRAAALFAEQTPETAGAYLSGIVIGHELKEALATAEPPLVLIGEQELTGLYQTALSHLGHAARRLAPDVAARGLYKLATAGRPT